MSTSFSLTRFRFVLHSIVLLLFQFCWCARAQSLYPEHKNQKPYLLFNQKLIEGLSSTVDVENRDDIFRLVFSRLPDSVYVYPTENYYYFQFLASGKWYWGNFRLGVMERDSGYIHFNYFDFIDDPQNPDESISRSKRFGPADGVIVKQTGPLLYRVSAFGRSILFQLNRYENLPPRLFPLASDEEFLMRSQDESGYRFFLVLKRTYPHFMWILNEELGIPGRLDSIAHDILLDRLSGFAFYHDRARGNRKILIGVRAQNVRRNNYWDGPFDQLADNYADARFSEAIQEVYPYTRGRVDSLGIFTDMEASRLAISPYTDYETIDELLKTLEDCRKQPPEEFLPCITYDYKIHIR